MYGQSVCLNSIFNFYSMNYEERIWSLACSGSNIETPLYIWDAGDEQWELYENGDLRHYRILHREFMDAGSIRVKEVLERLEYSSVPREVFAKHSKSKILGGVEKPKPALACEIVPNITIWELHSLEHWIPHNALLYKMPPAICE